MLEKTQKKLCAHLANTLHTPRTYLTCAFNPVNNQTSTMRGHKNHNTIQYNTIQYKIIPAHPYRQPSAGSYARIIRTIRPDGRQYAVDAATQLLYIAAAVCNLPVSSVVIDDRLYIYTRTTDKPHAGGKNTKQYHLCTRRVATSTYGDERDNNIGLVFGYV